jgi:hypothetical protein
MSATEYRKLVIIVWLTVIASMAAIWGPRAWSGASWDTDDFMRLVQVRDWLGGQAWSDLAQYRLNPPGGTAMHWSRLPDLALAAVTLAVSPFASMNDALTVAGMILPPLYFLIFIILYARPARMMLGAARSPVGLLVVISGSAMITQFAPGRVDHHGLQLVMVMAATALLLLGLARERWRWMIALAGIPIGLSIWIGLEMIALIAAWFAALGLVWCRSGGSLARQGAIAAGIATVMGVVLLLTSVAPAYRWIPACDALSTMPVGVLALVAGGFAIMHLAQRWAHTPVTRLLVGALCGAVVAAVFAKSFPQCLAGPYENLDPEIVRWWLSNVPEALPLSAQFRTQPFIAIDKVWVPLLGLSYCLWRCIRARGHGRNLWGALAVMLALSTPLIFWQIRATFGAHVVALIPLAALIAEVWQRLGGHSGPRWRRFAILLPVLFVGSAVFWPALEKGYRIASAFAPGKPSSGLVMLLQDCITRDDLPVLADVSPTNTLAYVDVGPVILFSTPHAVLGGPYHRNQAGLKATIALFRSEDDAWIRENLRKLGIGLIATCPGPEDMVMYPTQNKNGLAERLAAGRLPDYLREIPDPAHPGLRFYRVLP